MKVVLFCGGMGMRLRDYSDKIPKPLVEVGPRPILWHLMRYYSHFGHNDFIICLGYGSQRIKEFFLTYDERQMNDFVYADSGRTIDLLGSDIHDWRITFVDTGRTSNIGERLRRVQHHIGNDEMFLANYADGLSDLDLDAYVENFRATGKIACFMTVPAPHTFHNVRTDDDGSVVAIEHIGRTTVRVNAGFFALKREIFEYMRPDEELIIEPFNRLIEERQLVAVPYDGYWQPMDTFKDKNVLDETYERGNPPWEVWDRSATDAEAEAEGGQSPSAT
jgi:glucose-1-phosphate cytidylyltransferase